MAPLSRLTSAAADEANRRLLRILEIELGKITDPAKRSNPPIEFWNHIAEQCHEKRIMRHFNGFALRSQKWPQLCRLVAQRFEKGKNLSAKDKLIIRTRQLQDPTFCAKSLDEVIVLPCNTIPVFSDDEGNIPEVQDLQINDAEEREEHSFENQVPQQNCIPPFLPPFIFPSFPGYNSSLYDYALRAFTHRNTMAAWDHQLREMFNMHDKDMSGSIGKEDIMCMLLAADKDEQRDPLFKTNLKFLINVIKSADVDGDQKISFEEFKQYIEKANEEATK